MFLWCCSGFSVILTYRSSGLLFYSIEDKSSNARYLLNSMHMYVSYCVALCARAEMLELKTNIEYNNSTSHRITNRLQRSSPPCQNSKNILLHGMSTVCHKQKPETCLIINYQLQFCMYGLRKIIQFHVSSTSPAFQWLLLRKRNKRRQRDVWMFQCSNHTFSTSDCFRTCQK